MPDNKKDPSKFIVTVVGAGIAGLSAAQELVLRGFKVNLVDPQLADYVFARTLDRGIGGMARSQYVTVLPPPPRKPNEPEKAPRPIRRWVSSKTFLADEVIEFRTENGQTAFTDAAAAKLLIERFASAVKFLKAVGQDPYNTWFVLPAGSGAPSVEDRKALVKAELATLLAGTEFDLDQYFPASGTSIEGAPQGVDVARLALFADGFKVAPAEHGFRFFPSFYRHLFDTMKRTEIVDPSDVEVGRRSVFDNLVPSECLGLARKAPEQSFTIPRAPLTSFEDVRKYFNLVLEQLQYTSDDISRYSLALFKYMTSSSKRRREQYETMSWGDFVELDRFSPIARTDIEFGPQMTAALRGSQSDARTQGNITVQLVLDQLRTTPNVDCTLDGPTSGAWLDHWRAFLAREDVRFIRGSFEFGAGGAPKFTGMAATTAQALANSKYFVLALDLVHMHRLAQTYDGADKATSDVQRVIDFVDKDLSGATLDQDLTRDAPAGPLQHLSGIQFYFDTTLMFWRGHTQYLDSPWGLTSIAQPQFWARSRDDSDPFRSVLSVDIGIWDKEYRGKTAWNCEFDELAELVWQQLAEHHTLAFKAKYGPKAELPRPIAYALDHDLASLGVRTKNQLKDSTPFLVNRTSRYDLRPGKVSNIPGEASHPHYQLFGNERYVMCGTFLRTYTRLTSMEGANESARHAVNAIIDHANAATEPCEIWDPETNELPDLAWLRELDVVLMKRGLPHFTDILGWRELPLGMNTNYLRGLAKELAK